MKTSETSKNFNLYSGYSSLRFRVIDTTSTKNLYSYYYFNDEKTKKLLFLKNIYVYESPSLQSVKYSYRAKFNKKDIFKVIDVIKITDSNTFIFCRKINKECCISLEEFITYLEKKEV